MENTRATATMTTERRLPSWKDIAAYFNRGIRTVQRWERNEGLPVHRLPHRAHSSVFACEEELEAWWERRSAALEDGAAPPEAARSIAVLPFSDVSRDRRHGYFCESVAEEITGALGRIGGLSVASRSSALHLHASGAGIRDIAGSLNVRTVLEGSLRHAGPRLRATVTLTDAATGYQMWSESYDLAASDSFAVQEEIASQVAAAVRRTLAPALESEECCLHARAFYDRQSSRDIEFALHLFVQAAALDPASAAAYAGMADCWSFLYLYCGSREALREQADWAAARAVELGPACAQAHASRGAALSAAARDEEAAAEFETALRLAPRLFEAAYFYAQHCFALGSFEKAAALCEKAMCARPEDYQTPLLAACCYDALGRHADAGAPRLLGIAAAERQVSLNPDCARAVYLAAGALAALGRSGEAIEWARRALDMRTGDALLLYNVACAYARAGSFDAAMKCLEEALQSGFAHQRWRASDNACRAGSPV